MRPAEDWVRAVRAVAPGRRLRVLNVCGGHERTISLSGMRDVLPDTVELIPGPGCPVCVCPEEDIHLAIRIAAEPGVTLVAFGDMLRVPANVPKGQPRSLEAARAAGADVVPIASPAEAWRLAETHPDRTIVFFAAGFETTMAPVAAAISQGVPENLSLLISGRRTWPVVKLLLGGGDVGFEALIAPGHVATVMGSQEWRFVSADHGLPTAVAGFTAEHLLAALVEVLEQHARQAPALANRYPEAVRPDGNPTGRTVLEQVFVIEDAPWRGIGVVPASGYTLRDSAHDARVRFAHLVQTDRKHAGAMPPGCRCADVVLGRTAPTGCPLYGTACTPSDPVGPCMVSDEGACHIWWASGKRRAAHPPSAATTASSPRNMGSESPCSAPERTPSSETNPSER